MTDRRKKILIALGVLVVVFAIFVMIYRGNSANYYITTIELKAKYKPGTTDKVRVAGQIISESVDFDQVNSVLKFKIVDDENKVKIPVSYSGITPDTFNPDGKVIVEGNYTTSGLIADNVLIRCPDKYLPEQAVGGVASLLGIEGLIYR